jgi:hypothetical protein
MDPKLSGKFRVVAERPYARLLMILTAGFMGAALVILGFQLGSERPLGPSHPPDALARSLEQSELRVKELERRLADLTLSQLMDDEAYERLRQTIKGLRDRLAETEEEIRLYRQLMTPAEQDVGLRIERLDLREGPAADEIEYRLLLTQIVEDHDWIQGAIHIEVTGRGDQDQQVLSLTDLSNPGEYPLPFRFRYFQNFSGTLRLPDGFTPQRALVKVEPAGGDTRLERTFVWTLEEG